jgi:hypothetical protein
MKTTCILFLTLALTTATADTLVQWNFNSNPPDGVQGTGTTIPSVGAGTISVVGTTLQGTGTADYSSGNGSTDPATADDSAFHTRNYPLQGEGNKTSGIQVNVSTIGFESIIITWDQQNSATANKYLRFQYSLDGSTFVDYTVLRMDVATSFVNSRTVNLGAILGANGNPNFAFRLVSEFESTATGSGSAGYVTTGAGTYSQNGTMRFDMLTVSGSLPDGNAFPTISSIPNQTTRVDTVTDPIPFQIGDAETPADQLIVTGTSSNPTLVSDAGIVFEGAGANRAVTVGPNFDQTGTTTIAIYVIDGGGKSNSTSFALTVSPGNTAPTLSTFTNVHTISNIAFAPINFTVSDAEEPADGLIVSATSSDEAVVPNANLVITGAGGNRTLTITPADNQVGNSVITVTVTDSGGLSASRSFNAMVVSSSSVVLSEPFNYTDGPLTTNSGGLWTTRTGIPGQMQNTFGRVLVTSSQTEDVVARLIGGPYQTNSSTILYASFDVTFRAPPEVLPDIFAHFSGTDASQLRARVVASTTNAAPGSFRLGVANGGAVSSAANVVDYPLDLFLDTTYKVVVAYDVRAGTSKLWVNPASGGAWVSAIDQVSLTPINSYALRQSGGIGDSLIDNLLVGTSFEAVTPTLARARIRKVGDAVEVYWPSGGVWQGFVLESTPSLENPNWQPVGLPPVTVGDWDVVTITNPSGNEFFRLKGQ